MAKSDVVLKFDAQTAQYVQSVLAAKNVLDATSDSARKLSEQVVKSGDHLDHFAHKIKHGVGELAGMLSIPTSVFGALELTMKAIEARIQLAEQRANALKVRSATFEGAMFSLGTEGQASGIRRTLGRMSEETRGGMKFDDSMGENLFAKIVASVGTRATPDQLIAATRTAFDALARGANEGQAVQAGANMANVQALNPNMPEDEADTLARFLQLNAPGVMQDEKLLGGIARQRAGKRQGAASFMASAYQMFQGGRQIKPLMDLVESGRFTYEQIMDHPDLLPPKERAIARAIKEGEAKLRPVEGREQAIATALKGGDEISIAGRIQKNVEASKASLLDANASEDAISQAMVELAQTKMRERHPFIHGMMPAGLMEFLLRRETSQTPVNDDPAIFHGPGDEARREIQQEMRLLREAAQGIHQSVGGGPLLRNDSEGQK